MLMIRMARVGKIKQPLYRIVINEKTKDPWGDIMENLGTYNPRTKDAQLNIDRIKYWISKGAQTSDTLWNLFINKGIVEGKKRSVTKISKVRAEKIKTKIKEKTDKEEAAKLAAEEAKAKAEADAAAKAEADAAAKAEAEAKAKAEAQAPESAPDTPKAEEKPAETAPVEAPKAE